MAITYGMSVKEFWEENPDLFWAYRFSYYTRMEEQQELFNQQAWLQGAYFYHAISVALNNGFSKQKISYPDKPYDRQPNTEEKKNELQNKLVEKIKGRITQMEAIKGKEKESSTTDKGNAKGGEKIDGK